MKQTPHRLLVGYKYNIGDKVLFVRRQKTTGGTPIINPPELGIIEKVLYDGETKSYLMRSSYQAWVDEHEIQYRLSKAERDDDESDDE